MKKRTRRIIASVSKDLADRAREIAADREISISRVVERALAFYLRYEDESVVGQYGRLASNIRDRV